MTDDPNLPFQPPSGPRRQPGPGSGPGPGKPSVKSSGGYSLLGLFFGLAWGLVAPLIVGGLIAGMLGAMGVTAGLQLALSIIGAAVIVLGAFILVITQSDPNIPSQAGIRIAMKVSAITTVAVWGIGLLLVGLCFALLVGAYQ
jgi:hypothetical protein